MDLSLILGPLSMVSTLEAKNIERQWAIEDAQKMRELDSEMTGADMQRFQLNAAEAQKARDWNLQMDNTKYQRTVQDMQAAGVNPALAMNGGVSTQATSNVAASAPGASSLQTANYNRMELAQMLSAVGQLELQKQQLKLNERSLDIEEKKVNQGIEESEARTGLMLTEKEYNEVKNKYADEFFSLENEGKKLSNNLTAEQTNSIKQEIDESKHRVNKLIEETKNEVEKRDLIVAEKMLRYAETQEIVEMLPFKKALAAAQTDAARGAAAASFAKAAMDRGLIDAGYVEAVAKKAAMDANVSFSEAEMKAFASDIKHGRLFKEEGSTFERYSAKFLNETLGGLVSALSTIGDILPSGLLIAAK